MTLFRVASDVHLEFYTFRSQSPMKGREINDYMVLEPQPDEKDQILLLAGDIVTAATAHHYTGFFDSISDRFKAVYVIMGNHEHYKSNFLDTGSILRDFYSTWKNIHFMDNDVVYIDDVALFGGTLWTDFECGNPLYMAYARNIMSDYRIVSYGASDKNEPITYFTPELSTIQHNKCMQELIAFFTENSQMKKVVMTHHAPSRQSTHERFKGSFLNPAFSSDLDSFIESHKPLLWVHGHMHDNFDYNVGSTRVVCNPYGYHGENPINYKKDFVIEI